MKRSIALFLSVFLLIGQTGFTFATHYCGGHAVKTGLVLGNHLPDCGMKAMMACEMSSPDHHNDDFNVKRQPCCENRFTTVEANPALQEMVLESNLELSEAVDIVYNNDLSLFDGFTRFSHYDNQSPPGYRRDPLSFFQTFLI